MREAALLVEEIDADGNEPRHYRPVTGGRQVRSVNPLGPREDGAECIPNSGRLLKRAGTKGWLAVHSTTTATKITSLLSSDSRRSILPATGNHTHRGHER